MYSDDELVKEEDENLTSEAPLEFGTVTTVTLASRHGLSRSISKNTAEYRGQRPRQPLVPAFVPPLAGPLWVHRPLLVLANGGCLTSRIR